MENESDKKIEQIIEALESPSSFTPDELKELFSDKENLKIARSILRAKEALARQNIPAPEVDREWEKFKCRHKKKSTLVIFIGLVTAACITLLFILNFTKSFNKDLKIFEASRLTQTIQQDTINGQVVICIPRGMQKQIMLPDGTTVTLNAESQLTYDYTKFGKNDRSVIIDGEGLFDVVKDSLHPFLVQSEKLSTRVLGTVFNFRNYKTEEPKVTLLSGSLKVVSLHNNESLNINPGEQAVLTEKNHLRSITTSQTNAITSWHNGEFYFDNQTLAEILCELGRWYNVSVIFKDKTSMNDRLHFKAYRNEQLSSIVELLNYICKKPIIIADDAIIVGK